MKRMICAMLAVLLLLPVFATTAFAHGHGGHSGHGHAVQQPCVTRQPCVPENNCVTNGNCANKCQFVDENGDKI